MGKNYAARCARCGARKEALVAVDEGFAALEALFLKGAAAVDELVDVARALRRLPLVDPFLPTVSTLLGLYRVSPAHRVTMLQLDVSCCL
jgi:nucleolar GTP-binding protein